MANINARIAKEIILAQMASDSGKSITDHIISGESARRSEIWGYEVKQIHIYNAIKAINSVKICDFTYYITEDNGMPLVYFETKANGKKIQISFHNPGWEWLKSQKGHGKATRWDKNLGGSREGCYILAEKYRLI